MDVSSDSRLAAARKQECAKCAKYDRINLRDELDGRTVCCGCMRAHRDFSACFTASLHMDDSRFHYGMCNDCVLTLTVEAGSAPLLRTFKTFSVPGAAAMMGRSDAGGSIPDPTTPEGVSVDLGNGVMVTETATPKMDAGEKEGGGGGGGGGSGDGVQRALPPPVVDLWSVRRVAAKAKAAYAALPSASAGVVVTAAAAAAAAVGAAAVAAAARPGSSASASYALKPAKVAGVGGGGGAAAAGGGAGGARGGGGVERSSMCKRPKKLDDVKSSSSSDGGGCDDKKNCKSSSDGSGSTAPNSLEESVKFFSDGGSSGSSGRDGGGGGSLASASRTSSSGNMGMDMAAAAAATAAAAAVAASLQDHRPQQQQQQRATSLAGVRARTQALERKIAGFEDVPTLSMEGGSESLAGMGGRSISGSSSSGFVGNLSGRAVVVAGGGDEGGKGKAYGNGDGGGGGCGGEEGTEKERENVETGGGRRSRLFYCGVAAVGVGLVGAAVWAFGGRPSRR